MPTSTTTTPREEIIDSPDKPFTLTPELFDDLVGYVTRKTMERLEQYGALPPSPLTRLLITREEAARLLSVSVRAIDKLCSSGQLPAVQIRPSGKRAIVRLHLKDVEDYIKRSTTGPQDLQHSHVSHEEQVSTLRGMLRDLAETG